MLTLRQLPEHLDDGTKLFAKRPRLYEVIGLSSGQRAGMFRREERWTAVLSMGHGRKWQGNYDTDEDALAAI
jgi:hypothetical protein